MPIFWFGLLADLLVFGGISFGLPFLATHLAAYEGFTKGWIGFYFSAPAIAFFLNCLLIRSYTRILPRRLVITCGLIFYATALFCVATSPLLSMTNNPYTILFGLILLGWSAVLVVVPMVPELLSSIETQYPHLKGEQLNNVISGYVNTSISTGEALGPVTSGIMTEIIGFRKSLDLYAATMVVFTILFFLCNKNILQT